MWASFTNFIFFYGFLFPLFVLSNRKSRRPATPSFVLGVVMWLWMVWSPTPPTSCRSELAPLQDMELAAPVSSLRPVLTVSLANSRCFTAEVKHMVRLMFGLLIYTQGLWMLRLCYCSDWNHLTIHASFCAALFYSLHVRWFNPYFKDGWDRRSYSDE